MKDNVKMFSSKKWVCGICRRRDGLWSLLKKKKAPLPSKDAFHLVQNSKTNKAAPDHDHHAQTWRLTITNKGVTFLEVFIGAVAVTARLKIL